ncbi:MAG: hypothetical protein U1E46_05190 [Hyphomicrobiales bacterium]
MSSLLDLLRGFISPSQWLGIPGLGFIPDETFVVMAIFSVVGALILNFFVQHRTWMNGAINAGALLASGVVANFAYQAVGYKVLDSVAIAAVVANVGMIIMALLIIYFSRNAA